MNNIWNLLTLEVPIVVAVVATAFIAVDKLGTPAGDAVAYEQEQTQQELQWQRCGQYGLGYYEADNGFYNCLKKG